MSEPVTGTLLRLAAFTTDPNGGNPAGVWFGDTLPSDQDMLRIARDVGYSETAFLAPDGSGVAGPVPGPLLQCARRGPVLRTRHDRERRGPRRARPRGAAGLPRRPWSARPRRRTTARSSSPSRPTSDGLARATLTSVATWVREPEPALLAGALELLGWRTDELDPDLPPAVAYAGVKHLILAARDLDRLAHLDYPFEALRSLMLDADLTTLQLVWREAPDRFRARDPFPVGGVVEDPATGAAAAALGAYLRERGEISPPASFEVLQGVEMGRPGRLIVTIVPGEAGVRVSGNAVPIAHHGQGPSPLGRATLLDR